MVAVMRAPRVVVTFCQLVIGVLTINVVEPDHSVARPIGVDVGLCWSIEAELFADDAGVRRVPVIPAHRPPLAVEIDLHSALGLGRAFSGQTDTEGIWMTRAIRMIVSSSFCIINYLALVLLNIIIPPYSIIPIVPPPTHTHTHTNYTRTLTSIALEIVNQSKYALRLWNYH